MYVTPFILGCENFCTG